MPDGATAGHRLNALLVGLGQIGVGYDLAPGAEHQVFTHAKALACDARFAMVAGVDSAPAGRQRFEHAYGVPSFDRVAAIPDTRVDLAIVAAPTTVHRQLIAEILDTVTPRAILCEKPLAYSLDDARWIVDACGQRGVALFVNFIRRADSATREVKRRIESGRIQTPVKGVVWYAKGFLHNGSHFVDLLSDWLGPVSGGRCVSPGEPWGEHDRAADVRLTFPGGDVLFAAVPPGAPSHHAIELIAGNGRLRYDRGGAIVEWQPAAAHPQQPAETVLQDTIERIPSALDRYQALVLNDLSAAMDGDAHALCTGAHALATQQAMHAAMDTPA